MPPLGTASTSDRRNPGHRNHSVCQSQTPARDKDKAPPGHRRDLLQERAVKLPVDHWPSLLQPHWSARHSATGRPTKTESQMSRKLGERTYWQYLRWIPKLLFPNQRAVYEEKELTDPQTFEMSRKRHSEIPSDCPHSIRFTSVPEETERIIHCEMCVETIPSGYISTFSDFGET